jgi:hypothetical protein
VLLELAEETSTSAFALPFVRLVGGAGLGKSSTGVVLRRVAVRQSQCCFDLHEVVFVVTACEDVTLFVGVETGATKESASQGYVGEARTVILLDHLGIRAIHFPEVSKHRLVRASATAFEVLIRYVALLIVELVGILRNRFRCLTSARRPVSQLVGKWWSTQLCRRAGARAEQQAGADPTQCRAFRCEPTRLKGPDGGRGPGQVHGAAARAEIYWRLSAEA